MEKVIQLVNKVLVENFEMDPADLTPEKRINDDLGLDSLDAVDMIVLLEKQIGRKVNGEQFVKVKTLQDVYVIVDQLMGSSG